MMKLFLSHRHQSRRHRQSRRARVRALIVLFSLVSGIAISALSAVSSDFRALDAIQRPASPQLETAEPAGEPRLPARAVFRHSVVEGGVFSADDVEAAIGRDGVVAAHYAALDPSKLRVETVSEDRAVYMSYRIGDDVLWTKHKVRLKRGETILTDGVNQIRTRCGNCIALAAMEPTADDEPGEMEFDALTDDSDVLQSRIPPGGDSLAPFVEAPLPWASTGPSGASRVSRRGIEWNSGFGFVADPSDPGASAEDLSEIILFPAVEVELPTQGFPLPGAPLPQTGPQHEGNPATPDHPAIPGNPGVFPGQPENELPNFPQLDTTIVPVPVPEPATLLLVAGGLSTLIARRRRR